METNLDKIFGFSDLGIQQSRNIPKKSFYEQDIFNAAQKTLFTNDIDKLRIIAICDKDTINIETHVNDERVYKEILFIQVELKDKSKQKKISEIIHQVIPNPAVLIFTHENEILVSVAPKRLNKQEKGKIVIEEEYNSIWVDTENATEEQNKFHNSLYLKNFRFDNLHSFYSDISKAVIFSRFIEIIGAYAYSKNSDLQKTTELAKKLQQIQEKIVFHSNEEKRLKNFGDKVANHQKLIDSQKELENIKQAISDL